MIHDVKVFFSVNAFVRQDGRNKCFPHSFPIQSGIPGKSRGKGFILHITDGEQIAFSTSDTEMPAGTDCMLFYFSAFIVS